MSEAYGVYSTALRRWWLNHREGMIRLALVARSPTFVALVILGVGAVSCSEPTGPESGPQPGVIRFHSDPVVVQAPDTAQAAVPFQVLVRTYGNGCVSKGSTGVQIAGSSIDVRPYDVHSGANVCTEVLNMFDHEATVTVEDAGSYAVRFIGRAMPGGSMVTIVRSVVVQ